MAASAVILSCLFAWSRAGEDKKEGKQEEKEQEREVSLKQVPKPVKATILKQAGGNKIVEIEEVTQGKRKFYEAAWIKGGEEIEIKVAPNGKLLGKETEEIKGRRKPRDDDEDEDEDGEDEDDEDEGDEDEDDD